MFLGDKPLQQPEAEEYEDIEPVVATFCYNSYTARFFMSDGSYMNATFYKATIV